jgi:hypothetical protein
MPLRNRVDPWGDLHAVPARGLVTGNRGCLVDGSGDVVRHHRGDLWIICLTSYRGWRHPLTAPRVWTPVFFLDDAAALAAGHRPCGLCRRPDYLAYKGAVLSPAMPATELNRRLAAERLRPGRGVDRRRDRVTWRADSEQLPDGTVVLLEGRVPHLLLDGSSLAFTFDGWADRRPRPSGEVEVLTPVTSVRALAGGFQPILHESAGPT